MKKLITFVVFAAMIFSANLALTGGHPKDLSKRYVFLGETINSFSFIDMNSIKRDKKGITTYFAVLNFKRSEGAFYAILLDGLKDGQIPIAVFSEIYFDCRNNRLQTTKNAITGFDKNSNDPTEIRVLQTIDRPLSDDEWVNIKEKPSERIKKIICGDEY